MPAVREIRKTHRYVAMRPGDWEISNRLSAGVVCSRVPWVCSSLHKQAPPLAQVHQQQRGVLLLPLIHNHTFKLSKPRMSVNGAQDVISAS